MPEERKSNDKLDSDSSEQKRSNDQQEPNNVKHNLRKEGSDSKNSDQKYFSLFSQNIARSEVKREKDRPRKSKQSKIIPPTLN